MIYLHVRTDEGKLASHQIAYQKLLEVQSLMEFLKFESSSIYSTSILSSSFFYSFNI